jgi:hypothetical protein
VKFLWLIVVGLVAMSLWQEYRFEQHVKRTNDRLENVENAN